MHVDVPLIPSSGPKKIERVVKNSEPVAEEHVHDEDQGAAIPKTEQQYVYFIGSYK